MLKILKRLRRWKNSSGFTLVEVIVASALLGVLVLGVFGFVSPVLKNVATMQQNARAVMLAETINSYVSNNLKYAYYVQTFSGVVTSQTQASSSNPAAVVTRTFTNSDSSKPYLDNYNDKGLNDLLSFYDGLNASAPNIYEIRCIGIRWLADPKTGEKKLFVTSEQVIQDDKTDLKYGSINLAKTKMVFESCFYDNLYPIITFDNYDNQYYIPDDAGTLQPQVDDANLDIAKSLMITTQVYMDEDCYNTDETARKMALMTFQGTGYAPLQIINNPMLNSGDYEILPDIEMNSYSAAQSASGETDYYYPDTFIYFVCRRSKT